MTADRHLLLGRPLPGGGGRWLALDLLAGTKVWETAGPDDIPAEAPGAFLAAGRGEPHLESTGGGVRLSEDLLWSLVDPAGAGRDPENLPAEPSAAAAALREERRRFLAGWHRWHQLPGTVRADCRGLWMTHAPALLPLLDLLETPPAADRLSEPSCPEPATPATPLPAEAEALGRWLAAPDGLGACYGKGFAPRAEQADMGRRVADALATKQALALEAGTGVGKTLAYLAALVGTVRDQGRRAVVSTYTRALQTQLLEQDLPRLAGQLGDRSFALLMGRRNYLCLRQRLAYLTRPVEDAADALRAVAFRVWLAGTADGTREEVAAHPLLARDLRELFDGPEPCLPGACYEGERCFVQRARRRARRADLLVVNHSLLMHDLAAGGTLIGERDHLVVDEAHRLPPVALDCSAVVCGSRRWDDLEKLVGRVTAAGPPERIALAVSRLALLGPEGEAVASACGFFAAALAGAGVAWRAWWQALAATVDEELPAAGRSPGRRRVGDKDVAFARLRPETSALLEELARTSEVFAGLAAAAGALAEPGPQLVDDLAVLGQAGHMVRELHHDVRFLMTDPSPDWVTWIEPGPHRGVRLLGATRLEAGALLREYWLETSCHPVMTSATLAVGEDFGHMLGELGLTRRRPPALTAVCPSPFDYRTQSLVLVPSRFPGPEERFFGRAVGEVLRELALRTGRKTMGLFTSYRLLADVAGELEAAGLGSGEGTGPDLLVQESGGSAATLAARFRRLRSAVLLGTSTFWEGVDFPGDDLEILVVTKLPFLVPNDPWVEARCQRLEAAGENPFTAFMVRDAVLRLRQGCGRLIRRPTDRGVVVVLDTRLHTRNYGTTFLNALPAMPAGFGDTNELLDRVEAFFHEQQPRGTGPGGSP